MNKKHEPKTISLPDAEKLYTDEERWQAVLEKWRMIVEIYEAGDIPANIHGESCAFCVYYTTDETDCYTEDDEECPILKETREEQCVTTPFNDVAQNRDNPKLALEPARKMLRFLEDLYKKTHPEPSPTQELFNELSEDGYNPVLRENDISVDTSLLWFFDVERFVELARKYNALFWIGLENGKIHINFHDIGKYKHDC
jgi:hypothetical protein